MRKDDVGNLKLSDLKHVFTPLKRGRALKPENYVDIGFDTEFTSEDNAAERKLLSIQFSLGKDKSKLYEIRKCEGVSSKELLDYALKFLRDMNVESCKHIFLIAHYAVAELSKVNDFYDEYKTTKNNREITVRPRVSEFNKAIRWEKHFDDAGITLHIADLYGHMKTSLEKVGAAIGFQKIQLEADGFGRNYWIEHMEELLDKHPEVYETYAIRDAEVAIEAWRTIIKEYEPLNLDPHLYGTYTSMAVAAFRRKMTKLPCPTEETLNLSSQKMKGDVWREHIVRSLEFAGDLNAREMACLAYWGGNNQAFARGYFPDIMATQWDFKSLYIIAGILQPLSNCDTEYKRIELRDVENDAEGFCEVNFEFPPDTMCPTLPVQENYYKKLMFPMRGHSYCTAAELRQALKQNVKVLSFRGYGFTPTESEKNNELKTFLADMLKKKSELEANGKRDSSEYQLEKGKMVGIIGRFAYMKPSHLAEDITRLMHVSGLQSEEFRRFGKKKAMRALYTRSEVGGSWHIEWASLILGRARSLAGWAINQGQCLTISTDGGFWLGNPRFDESAVSRELEKFHSGIRKENDVDELWIGRNRCYVAWLRGKMVYEAQGGIAVEGNSSEEKKINFEKMVRENLAAHKQVKTECETKRLTGLMDYIYDNLSLNTRINKKKVVKWRWDNKRKLECDINEWEGNTWTKPYETVDEAYRTENPAKTSGRPKVSLTEEQILEIRATAKNVTHAALAKKYGELIGHKLSVSTIKRLRGD